MPALSESIELGVPEVNTNEVLVDVILSDHVTEAFRMFQAVLVFAWIAAFAASYLFCMFLFVRQYAEFNNWHIRKELFTAHYYRGINCALRSYINESAKFLALVLVVQWAVINAASLTFKCSYREKAWAYTQRHIATNSSQLLFVGFCVYVLLSCYVCFSS